MIVEPLISCFLETWVVDTIMIPRPKMKAQDKKLLSQLIETLDNFVIGNTQASVAEDEKLEPQNGDSEGK